MRGEVLFLGTGIMGAPMAARLHRAGLRVLAWNRSPERLAPLAAVGVDTATSLSGLPIGRRTVVVMVSTGDIVDAVLFGAAGAAPVVDVLAPGSTVVVMSSIPVDAAREQHARLERLGIRYVDAPVSGGERAARDGTLTIMAGGAPGDLEALASILAPLGTVTHVGPVGCGSLAKLANQLIVGITIGAVAEALTLVELGGGDPAACRQALLGGFASSTILRQHGERMLTSNFAPGAHATTQLKDLETALAFAAAHSAELPLLARCTMLYRELCSTERRDLDHSALFLASRERAGLGAR